MKEEINYSVVISVFNSSDTISVLANRIHKVFSEYTPPQSYEIIFVNDGSTNPETKKALEEVQKTNPNIHVIELTRNFGQQAATLCGIKHARGNFIITMDDDLQHNPEDIPSLIKMQHHDIVIGNFKESKHSLDRRIGSQIKNYFDWLLLDKPKHIKLSSFRLINRVIAENMLKIETPFPYIPALLLYISKDLVNADVGHQKRMSGKSGYSLGKQLRLISNLLINNSSLLLKLIAISGIMVSIMSFSFMIYFLVKKIFFGIPIIGWTSLMFTITCIGGVLLFSVGILGEYLIRIVKGVEKRPMYIIRHQSKYHS
jgi:dolichol-phosphate mannosyltransferase/undecaprenyl-phosphate 4-deoxy-4-formamido-L-arabinose transferase